MEAKVFVFKASLKRSLYRIIQVKGAFNLCELASAIVTSFNFECDHSFGFYDNIRDTYRSTEAYTLFFDHGDPVDPIERSVRNSYVHQVFEAGKKMMFLFDYGDDWHFLLECLDITEQEAGKVYPIVIKEKGQAPPQYPADSSDEHVEE